MPGSGKSTTANFISDKLTGLHIDNKLFLETSADNPLFINTPAIHSLSSEEESDEFFRKVISLYSNFVEAYKEKQTVVIIESLIYEGIVSVALFKGMKETKVKELANRIIEIINPMNPAFIFYYQMDAERNWRRICNVRGPEFAKVCGLQTDADFQRAAEGWSYTQHLFCELLNEWNIPTTVIRNTDYEWDEYNKKILSFLSLD